ncbi:MAG: DUF4382 domain-containing protein [Gammaproteobacteria bacterium]|nr:DUF4382 domain-containing protein [Gammaproteobacteria bacterium]
MMDFKQLWTFMRIGAAAFVLTLAAGCGGGGDGGGEVETGTVSVLVTDAPTRDFWSFKVTVSRIELFASDGRRATVKTAESTLDLLRLENFSNLFAHNPEIPAGEYNKIRLTLKRVELVERRSRRSIFPLLTHGFKLDLLPASPFTVTPGSRLAVEIDIDARRSVRWRSGGWRFRPVVFVKVGVEQVSHLVEIRGVVSDINPLTDSFRICRVDEGDAGITLTDECMTARLADASSIFNPDGVQGGINDLVETEIVKVVGNLDPANDSVIDVKAVQRDALAAYARIYGTVLSPPDVDSEFDLTMDADQVASTDPVVAVQLQAGTKVFDGSGTELDASSIAVDQVAEASGVLAASPTDPDKLWAEWVVVTESTPPAAELEVLTGFVLARTAEAVTLFNNDASDHCVRILPDADIQVTTESSTGTSTGPGTLEDISLGREVDLYGTTVGDGCFEAQSVVVFVIAD